MDSKTHMKPNVQLIIGLCMVVLLGYAYNDAFAQPVASGNTTTGTVTETPPTNVPLTAAVDNTTSGNSTGNTINAVNQTVNSGSSTVPEQELNQTAVQPTSQNVSQSNQTTTYDSSKSGNTSLNENLLNFTNNAILALSDDNETQIQQNLIQIQDALIKAIGKPVVIIPAPALETDSGSD